MYKSILTLLALLTTLATANVEKAIFIAPPSTTIPSSGPDIDDLGVERLSPEDPIVRTQLNASFPTALAPEGTESWFFLENLKPGQRYEVRVCWLATVCPLLPIFIQSIPNLILTSTLKQPTTFTLTTYPLSTTIEDITLLSSLSIFSSARLASIKTQLNTNTLTRRTTQHNLKKGSPDPAPTTDSVLFLRVRAAADYYSADKTLMQDVPPVKVELIIDPFLWNVFPRSLVPTAGWIAVVGLVALVVARWIAGEFGRVVVDARRARVVGMDKKER